MRKRTASECAPGAARIASAGALFAVLLGATPSRAAFTETLPATISLMSGSVTFVISTANG